MLTWRLQYNRVHDEWDELGHFVVYMLLVQLIHQYDNDWQLSQYLEWHVSLWDEVILKQAEYWVTGQLLGWGYTETSILTDRSAFWMRLYWNTDIIASKNTDLPSRKCFKNTDLTITVQQEMFKRSITTREVDGSRKRSMRSVGMQWTLLTIMKTQPPYVNAIHSQLDCRFYTWVPHEMNEA